MQTQRITGNHIVLHINAITKLYYIFQLNTFLIYKNMANMKTQNPCIITNSTWIVWEKKSGMVIYKTIKLRFITLYIKCCLRHQQIIARKPFIIS